MTEGTNEVLRRLLGGIAAVFALMFFVHVYLSVIGA